MTAGRYNLFQLAKRYIRYYLRADNGQGHGIHSPFVYAFVCDVLNDRKNYYSYQVIESLRQRLKKDQTPLQIEDLGAGSSKNTNTRTVSTIVSSTAKPPKLAKLLFRAVNYFQPSLIIEMGTSLGLGTAYLSMGNSTARVYTLEGANEVAEKAAENFRHLNLFAVELIRGNFDDTLEPLLQKVGHPDLVFIDGNHRYDATMRYFQTLLKVVHEDTILIFDDIHWSPEMEKAWEEIKQHPAVTCTIDLFFMGYVFFRPEFKVRQHFEIRF